MSLDFIKSLYYEFLSYFVPEKIIYKLEGQCIQCGKCCKNIRIYGLNNEKELKIMQFFFPRYRHLFIRTKDDNNFVLSCKYLTSENKCSIYNKRPNFCKNYPSKYTNCNTEMIDGCGYKIIKKNFKDYL